MDIFQTAVLNAIVRDLRVPQSGLASRYFSTISQSDSEMVYFDVEHGARRMSPFVSPLVAGTIVKSRGYEVKSFRPAYIKDKRTFHPNRSFTRAIGERIGGGDLTPQQRIQALVVQDLTDQMQMLERRMEWMAAKILLHGAITISGESYPAEPLDFGRNANHTKVLSGAQCWDQTTGSGASKVSTVNPLDDLQDWSDAMVQRTGLPITDVIMTIDAWKIFRSNTFVKDILDRYRGDSTLVPNAHIGEGLVPQRRIDQFNIYTYSSWVQNSTTGLEEPYLPPYTVLCTAEPAQVQGVRHFGAIQDHGSLVATPYYVSSWKENDPSMLYLLMQTAPLLVPYRPDATMRATIKS